MIGHARSAAVSYAGAAKLLCQSSISRSKIRYYKVAMSGLLEMALTDKCRSDGPSDKFGVFFAGHFSWRNTQQGSWFIRALNDELKKALSSTDSVDFAQVLTKVTRTVAYDFQSNVATREQSGKKQVPSLYSTLTKEIHFPNIVFA